MQYGGGGGHRFMKVFHKIPVFFERWLPLTELTRGSSLCLEQLLARLLIYLVLGPLRVSEN